MTAPDPRGYAELQAPKIDARQMRHRLRSKYAGRKGAGNLPSEANGLPDHAIMFEVPIDGRPRFQGGSIPTRQRIDAVAVGLVKSTGHLIHGFEIKVSRSDLLVELRDPTKAEASARAVDRWWLALGSRDLLRDGDPLPDGWGVLAAVGRGLRVIREPAPQPGERDGRIIAGFLQASLREHGACRGLGWRDGYMAGVARGEDRGKRLCGHGIEVLGLRAMVAELAEAAGRPNPLADEVRNAG